MTYAYHAYPADFLQKTKENVKKVTKADVLRVAKAHLRPGQSCRMGFSPCGF